MVPSPELQPSCPGLESHWKQFRFGVGAPDAEVKFANALKEAQAEDANSKVYPSLYVSYYGYPFPNLLD